MGQVKVCTTMAVRTVLLGSLFLLGAPPQVMGEDLLGGGFEKFTGIPAEAAQAVPDNELEDLRGMYLGFYFAVTFSGMVDVAGAVNGTLNVNAGLGNQNGGLSFQANQPTAGTGGGSMAGGPSVTVRDGVTGEAFRVQAGIGDGAFNGSQGVFQINQIPGNGNNILSHLTINLAIIQTPDSNLEKLQQQLRPLFGL